MNIEEEIEKCEKEIKALNLTKGLNLKTNQLSIVLGCSPSTCHKWKKSGFGPQYIAVPSLGKKKNTRIMYRIRAVAEWLVLKQVKTA